MSTTTSLRWPLVGRSVQLELVLSALADDAVRVVHLVGAAGTGKSRLARECLAAAELDGYPVAHVLAGDAAAAVPLSALSALLPAGQGPLDDPGSLVTAVADHVRELGDGSRVVVHADDVDALDAASCDLLHRLWRGGLLVLVATQRSGTPTPTAVLAEQRRGGVLSLQLDDLPRRQVATLLHHVLRGPVAAHAEHTLWSVAGGNPLFLRELVTGAVLAGRLAPVEGIWVLEGPLDVTGGLAGLVAERLGDLDGPARELVERLALCAPLGVDELAVHCPLDVLEDLEVRGVVTVVADHRRQEVQLAHPVYGQVLRDSLPRLRARRLLLDQVARTEAHGSRRRVDALRTAGWRLDATGTADPQLLLRAARLARAAHDYAQVERLARATLLLAPDVTAATLLGEALYEQGRFEEADAVLTEAGERLGERGSVEAAALALVHGIVLFFGAGRPDAALARLDAAAADAAGLPPQQRDDRLQSLDSMRALLLTQTGRSRDALAVLPSTPPPDPAMRAVHSRAHAWARHRTGLAALAAQVATAAWREQTTDGAPGLLHPAGDLVVAALAQLELGHPEQARALAGQGRDAAVAQGVPFQAAWLAWAVATVDLLTGYAEDARDAFRELAATAGRSGFGQAERLAALGMTECQALLGDPDGARRWYARAMELPPPPPAFAPATTTAQAWLAAAEGDRARAADLLREHGRELAARGELREATSLLDEAVLFGDTTAAHDLLQVAGQVDTPVSRARALRARALLSGDPTDLLAAAESFAGCDFVHSAATLGAQAAQALRAAGDPRAAAAAQARARAWAARSPGLRVDGLDETPGAALLTPREREIALLAARGRTSKDVAGDLVLSVRTVDNHLANVYAKLGITGRAQLADALGVAAPVRTSTPTDGPASAVPAARSGRDR